METTARRALNELIDQLCRPTPSEPQVEVPATVAALLDLPEVVTAPVVPAQQPIEPEALSAGSADLPGGARSAILWRSC